MVEQSLPKTWSKVKLDFKHKWGVGIAATPWHIMCSLWPEDNYQPEQELQKQGFGVVVFHAGRNSRPLSLKGKHSTTELQLQPTKISLSGELTSGWQEWRSRTALKQFNSIRKDLSFHTTGTCLRDSRLPYFSTWAFSAQDMSYYTYSPERETFKSTKTCVIETQMGKLYGRCHIPS